MSVHRYPGDFRIGVLNERRDGVLEPGPSQVQPKLMVLMLLSGWQKFRIEDWRIELDARQLPDAVMLRISTPCEMEYLFNWFCRK